jgi:hypothetical protein
MSKVRLHTMFGATLEYTSGADVWAGRNIAVTDQPLGA